MICGSITEPRLWTKPFVYILLSSYWKALLVVPKILIRTPIYNKRTLGRVWYKFSKFFSAPKMNTHDSLVDLTFWLLDPRICWEFRSSSWSNRSFWWVGTTVNRLILFPLVVWNSRHQFGRLWLNFDSLYHFFWLLAAWYIFGLFELHYGC